MGGEWVIRNYLLDDLVNIVHICVVMLGMVNVHCRRVNIRLQGIVGVGQVRELEEGHCEYVRRNERGGKTRR